MPLAVNLSSFVNSIPQAVSNLGTNSVSSVIDSSQARLNSAGLYKGGANSLATPGSAGVNIQSPSTSAGSSGTDWRVKLSLPQNSLGSLLYQNSPPQAIQGRLVSTGGVIFPYTPSITVIHNARYQEQNLTHTNYKNYFYEGSDVAAINITGDFTVQNVDDGLYLLAAIYFFRTCTKMFYGTENYAGNPPPIVYLDGYGKYYFPSVSCVITSFQHNMPGDVDYVQVPYSGQGPDNKPRSAASTGDTVWLPTTSQIQVTVQPVYSRKNTAGFTLEQFSQGQLLSKRFI